MELLTIYDNYTTSPELKNHWGFSCLICGPGGNLLFDTGTTGSILLGNMEKLDVDLQEIRDVVISHDHFDHFGGLADFLAKNSEVKVHVLSSSYQADGIAEVAGADRVASDAPRKIGEKIWTTGKLGADIDEQSLVIETEKGSVVVTGCSHPGIVDIVKKAEEIVPGKIYLVIGGWHLGGASDGRIREVMKEFRELGVEKAAPCHCSGDRTRELFAREYGDDFIASGVGNKINI